MRFNPLWLIFFLLFISGAGIFLLPLLLFFFLICGGLLLAGVSAGGAAALPKRLWKLAADSRVRANFALCHAVLQLLKVRSGAALDGRGEANGFFVEGTDAENTVYETAVQALARLKNGEKSLMIYPECRTFRMAAAAVLALALMVPCAALGPIGIVLALAGGYYGSPWLSPVLQGFVLRGSPVNSLTVQSAAFRRRTVTSFGGRFRSLESGVEVSTFAEDAIEAEIVEE